MLLPDPFLVTPPGYRVKTQEPEEGNPFSATLPVPTLQVGCVMLAIFGAWGVGGCKLMVTDPVEAEVQPSSLRTVKV